MFWKKIKENESKYLEKKNVKKTEKNMCNRDYCS